MTRIVPMLIVSLSAFATRQATAPQDPEAAAREALARPVSIGSVPFLIQHARYANVATRLADALRHGRPEVRAVAARSIYVLAGSRYGGPVGAALAAERDPVAGAEMVRALLAIRGASADPEAIAAAKRLGPAALNAVSVTLAHTRPLDLLPWLADLDPDWSGLPDALLKAIALDPEQVGRAIASLAPVDEVGALSRVFARAGETGMPIPSAVFDPALLRGGALRDAALLYLLEHDAEASGSRVLHDLVSSSARANASGWLSVLLELAARRDASAERRDLGPIIPTLDRAAAPAGLWRSLAMSRLSPNEARALRAHVFDDASVAEASQVAASPPLRDRDFRWARRGEWRTAEPFVAGLDAAIAQAAGCQPGAEEVTVVQIGYRAGGQVRQVRVDGARASAACRLAASALASLEVAPIAQVAAPDRTDYIVTAFARDALECEPRSSRGQRAQSTGGAGGVKEPQKLHDVRPIYPKHLIAARVQGAVIVEAVIDRTGCVNRAAVIGEAHADLNVAALAAITQWRYTPTLLNGEPVPVIMTVNSAFSLR